MQSADHIQSVLAPAGAQAHAIHALWSLNLWVAVAVLAGVVMMVGAALVVGRQRARHGRAATSEAVLTRTVSVAISATVVILLGLLVASVLTGRSTASLHASSAVSVVVTGHQWWWEIEYEDGVASRRVVTANEIHIPVARPAVLKVTSRDVIHSIWVPNLQGKRDLIPGYTTAIWLIADRPGIFRGQCAEFCGLQHAHMALDVIAETETDFEAWLDGMRANAPPPASADQRRGHDIFMTVRCAGCHTVRGTEAAGRLGPDLTHVASRRTLGAGTLPNSPAHLGAWVQNPQDSKPGNQMPANPLTAADLTSLVAYLETLK